jgi:hypothetical protein
MTSASRAAASSQPTGCAAGRPVNTAPAASGRPHAGYQAHTTSGTTKNLQSAAAAWQARTLHGGSGGSVEPDSGLVGQVGDPLGP